MPDENTWSQDAAAQVRAVRACVVGSTNMDLLLEVAALPQPGETALAIGQRREPGGKGANQASALARLGAQVVFVSAVGADPDGHRSLAALRAGGVAVEQVAVHEGATTGLAVVLVDRCGENAIVVTTGANDLVVSANSYAGFDVVLLSLEIPLRIVAEAVARAHAAGVLVVLNAAPASALPVDLLRMVDVLVVNEGELAVLGGQAEPLFAAGLGALVVTLGAAGCLVVEQSTQTQLAALPVNVLDTTGAGDCFAAALSAGLGAGWPAVRAAEFAVAAAALSVTHPGAQAGQPGLAEVVALLQAQ